MSVSQQASLGGTHRSGRQGAISRLFLIALASDLLTSILIWKAGLPAQFRWLSQVALALMMLSACLRLLRESHIPKAFCLVPIFTVMGAVPALAGGQSIAATLWGWWLMFKYPLAGLYAYLQPAWPEGWPRRLRQWCVRLLWCEVCVQIGQYLTGEMPGDDLAGTLAPRGTAHLVLVVLWVLAMVLGYWIAKGKGAPVILVLGLGMVSSALAEVKLFYFAAAAMGALALCIHAWRTRRVWQTVPIAVLLVAAAWLFPKLYDAVVPQQGPISFATYLDVGQMGRYLAEVRTVDGEYDVGRNYALAYVWQRASTSAQTLVWGEGLGARSESQTLGTAGSALRSGDLGLFSGTSLVVLMGELGLAGIAALTGFLAAVAVRLWKITITDLRPDMVGLAYGLFLYTLMWPLWLWYTTVWTLPVPMLLYWSALGYVLRCGRSRLGLEPPAQSRP